MSIAVPNPECYSSSLTDGNQEVANMAKVIETDVLVVGGGLAGFRAAMRAREIVDRVTLVDKATVARGGGTVFCHVMVAPCPRGARLDWLKDIVEHAEYMSDQEWADTVLEEQGARVKELEALGFSFQRDEKGDYVLMAPRGADKLRAIYYEGRKLAQRMKEVLVAAGVNLVERVMITDLVTSDGRYPTQGDIVGAIGLHTRTAESCIIKSGAVVVASGQLAGKLKIVDNLTGDGQAMAFRAGAELSGMEFAHWPNFSLCTRGADKQIRFLYSGAQFQNHGAWIVNAAGERIMERYTPELMERRSGFGLIGQAMAKEYLEGRGPLYFDMRHFPKEEVARLRKVLPQTMAAFDRAGLDISKDLVEFIPMVIHGGAGNGGIRTGLKGETTLAGLFTAGVAAQMRGCIEPPASFAQAVCNVFGYRAGENAAEYAAGRAEVAPRQAQAEELLKMILSPLGRRNGIRPDDIFLAANRVLVPWEFSMFKTEAGIKEALAELERIEKEDLPKVMAEQPHDLIKANEARNYLLMCRLYYIAARARKETRLCHYRQEYPYRDDMNWLNWITLRREGEDVKLNFEPIPIDRYLIRPPSLSKVPAPLQFSSGRLEESIS
jgi:succinate dehydrogenase/fumarate reductase flavoprotein subunit